MAGAGEIEWQSHHECMGSSAPAHSSWGGRAGAEKMLDRKEVDLAVIPGEDTMAHLAGRV
jgi:hypothetical protein